MKLSKITTCTFPISGSKEEQRFHAKNANKLATFLEKQVPDTQHDQCTWGHANSKHPCKTVGCALGWAAMSGLFPGLQYTKSRFTDSIEPVVNGEFYGWEIAGERFFGYEIVNDVFFGYGDKNYVVARLRQHAAQLRKG